MTLLIQEMSSTVVAAVNRGTFTLADWTLLPKKGIWNDFLSDHPDLKEWLTKLNESRKAKQRVEEGFQVQNPDENPNLNLNPSTIASLEETERNLERLTKEFETEHELAKELAISIKKVAKDLHAVVPIRYSYEQWAHFTKLIRFSRGSKEEVRAIEEEEGLVEWDWIGEDSPMLADISEAQWVLERLCESLARYTRKQASNVSSRPDSFSCLADRY
jgi:potassium channel subfamily K, other eukaryote